MEDTTRDAMAAITRIVLAVAEIRARLPSLATEADVAEIRATLPSLATEADVAEIRATLPSLATKEALAELRGYVKSLPTTWVMVTAIIAGQLGITGNIGGTLLAAARMFLHT